MKWQSVWKIIYFCLFWLVWEELKLLMQGMRTVRYNGFCLLYQLFVTVQIDMWYWLWVYGSVEYIHFLYKLIYLYDYLVIFIIFLATLLMRERGVYGQKYIESYFILNMPDSFILYYTIPNTPGHLLMRDNFSKTWLGAWFRWLREMQPSLNTKWYCQS